MSIYSLSTERTSMDIKIEREVKKTILHVHDANFTTETG